MKATLSENRIIGKFDGEYSWSRFLQEQVAFISGNFDFVDKILTDQTDNNNDILLKGGNCINFINDVTITLHDAQVGASVIQLNDSTSDLNGISVNGSGHIEIDVSELTNTKIWQFKLDTDDEFFLTGGTNSYIFCDSSLYGILGGTENVDWEWSTQDNYFRNLQYGYSQEGLLFTNVPADMTDAGWNTVDFVKTDATTVTYTGGVSASGSKFYNTNDMTVGKTYQIKLTVWDSTEDFEYNRVRFRYATAANIIIDDEGEMLSLNGVHYVTFTHEGGIHRVQFDFSNQGLDWTGRAMKFRIDYCKEVDYNILIPAHDDTTDCAGNTAIIPISSTQHNGCEVQLDFSVIPGVTDENGNPLSLPSDYSFGDTVTNPMFKRLQYGNDLEQFEGEYIITNSFQNGQNLTDLLEYLEEDNMLIKEIETNRFFVIKKFDENYDHVFDFHKVGYNEAFCLFRVGLMANTKPLPITYESEDISNQFGPFYSDIIGPFSIHSIGWTGGGHTQPDNDSIQPDWEEITAVDNDVDTVNVADTTEFPADNPSGKKRCLFVKNYSGGVYINGARPEYSVNGLMLELTPLLELTNVDLSGVVVGGPNPSYVEYMYKTLYPGIPTCSVANTADWNTCKSVIFTSTDSILDYTTINKATLDGDEIISEYTRFYLSQKSDNVYIVYQAEFQETRIVNVYYGLQGNNYFGTYENTPKIYTAHADNQTLRIDTGFTTGDRMLYPCEKIIVQADTITPSFLHNVANWMDLEYGTPAQNIGNNYYWSTIGDKHYFQNIVNTEYYAGELVKWRGGINIFKNLCSTYGVFAYWQANDGDLYFIIDFTDSLAFDVNEIFTQIAGRKCEIIYKNNAISIANNPDDIFIIPNNGLNLTATGPGNIKLKMP